MITVEKGLPLKDLKINFDDPPHSFVLYRELGESIFAKLKMCEGEVEDRDLVYAKDLIGEMRKYLDQAQDERSDEGHRREIENFIYHLKVASEKREA